MSCAQSFAPLGALQARHRKPPKIKQRISRRRRTRGVERWGSQQAGVQYKYSIKFCSLELGALQAREKGRGGN
jgi:hypothetical protein